MKRWLVGVVALLPILGAAGFWWLLVGSKWALYLAIALALFTLFDALVLVSLPRRRLSFGPMIFGHELARLMLYEQIYRALAIDRGIKYHRPAF